VSPQRSQFTIGATKAEIKSKTNKATTKMMNNKMTTVALVALLASSSAFTPAPRNTMSKLQTASTATMDLPYFIELKNTSQQEGGTVDMTPTQSAASMLEAPPPKKAKVAQAKAAKGDATHSDGIFSPVVKAAKVVLGEEQLNKVRAKAISKHSDIISSFVSTAEWPTGQVALKALFTVADKNRNGLIEAEELVTAFNVLGFTWLKEKQVRGIFARADTDENGFIDLHEWMTEAPKTLRTNLTKLAKKNGGELGFLV
jgi:hypothetical protein